MKNLAFLSATLVLIASCSAPSVAEEEVIDLGMEESPRVQSEPNLSLAWETDTLLTTNESVLYHPEEGVLYVSNIQGKPSEKDGKGSIAKLSTEGKILNRELITGLDAPKGMAVKNNTLYVTNVDELVVIDLGEYAITARYPVEGAKFLNDVTTDGEKVFFSDMETGKLHVFQNEKITTLYEGRKGLNGLAFSDGHLYGLDAEGLQVFKTDGSGAELLSDKVTGGDGLVVIDENTFLASRWQGEIWLIQNGEATKLLDSKTDEIQTADIGYIPQEKLVLVPRFFSNKVSAYKLSY